MKSYNVWVKLLVFNIICIVTAISLFNFVIDPLQFFRKANYQPVFSTNQRLQNVGIAKNYDYNTIVLGTSLTENFIPSYINNKWGSNTVKLSISGSTLKEQAMIADIALKTGKVATVLWGLDLHCLRWGPNDVKTDQGPFPYYLYDNNALAKVKYIFSGTTTEHSLKVVRSLLLRLQPESIDTLNNWQNESNFKQASVIQEYNKSLNANYSGSNNYLNVDMAYNYENFKENFDQNVIKLIEDNPNVRFILFFPPYSMPYYHYFYIKKSSIIDDWIKCKLYLVDQLSDKKNVEVFDFQDAYEIAYNLNNYKDMIHYSQNINEFLIDEIPKKSNVVKNRRHYLVRLENFKSNISMYSIDMVENKVNRQYAKFID